MPSRTEPSPEDDHLKTVSCFFTVATEYPVSLRAFVGLYGCQDEVCQVHFLSNRESTSCCLSWDGVSACSVRYQCSCSEIPRTCCGNSEEIWHQPCVCKRPPSSISVSGGATGKRYREFCNFGIVIFFFLSFRERSFFSHG